MDLQKMIQNYIGSMVAQKIGAKIGLSGDQTQSIITKVMPLLLGGMAKNATSSSEGAAALIGALTKDHDGSIFDKVDNLVDSPQQFKGAKILEHILGDREDAMEQVIAKEENLTPDKVKDVMTMLAPLVMGALGKEQTAGSLGTDDFMELFNKQQAVQEGSSNPLLGLLSSDKEDLLKMGMDLLRK